MPNGMRWSPEALDAYNRGKREAKAAAASVPEAEHLKMCLEFFDLHPLVDWCTRINTGMWQEEDRVIRFGFKGCADIIGQLVDGRMFAFEVKRVGNKPTLEQMAFLQRVARKGVSGWGQLTQAVAMLEEYERTRLGALIEPL